MEASEAQEIVDKRRSQIAENNPQARASTEVLQEHVAPASPHSTESVINQTSETERPQTGPTNPEPIETPNDSNISQFPKPDNLVENGQNVTVPESPQEERSAV